MNHDDSPASRVAPSSAPAPAALAVEQPTIPLTTLFAIFNHPVRWKLVQMLADGTAISATAAATVLKKDVDGIIKQLRFLRAKGVLKSMTSREDARYVLYYMPAAWRGHSGVLDFGSCIIRLPTKRG